MVGGIKGYYHLPRVSTILLLSILLVIGLLLVVTVAVVLLLAAVVIPGLATLVVLLPVTLTI